MTDELDRNLVEIERAYLVAKEAAYERSRELEGPSLLQRLAQLPEARRRAILSEFSTVDLARLAYHWPAWARPKQNPPLERYYRILLWLAGRNFGKTRSAAERVRARVYAGARSLAIMGPTITEIERYQLGTEGAPSGLLNVFHPLHRPVYVGGPKAVVRFHTGAVGYIVSGETPEFRGANIDTVWASEIAKWRFLEKLWHNMEFSCRARASVPLEIIVDTTPLPLVFLKQLIGDEDCVTIVGHLLENRANTDPTYTKRMLKRYGGTRLGRQEMEAEILDDNPDSLFLGTIIESTRVERGFVPNEMRTCVPVDPAIATEKGNDETGMGLMGIDERREHVYVFEDFSAKAKPEVWGAAVINRYMSAKADAVVCERNRGGDLVESNIRSCAERHRFKDGTTGGGAFAKSIVVENVHATKGKAIRAEPVSSLHKNGFLRFVGRHPELENEITNWNPKIPGPSPNRLDMMVWGAFWLAGLDKDSKPDYKQGFRGLAQVTTELKRTPATPVAGRSIASILGSDPWGRKI